VEACPTGALVFGDLDDSGSEIAILAADPKAEDFHPEFATDPLVRYSGIPKRFVAGEVVFSDKTEECAQGVKVVLEGDGQKLETVTDGFGDFEFDGLAQNMPYTVTIDQSGYATAKLDLVTRTDVNLGEIVLMP
jgi:hypothetical protein